MILVQLPVERHGLREVVVSGIVGGDSGMHFDYRESLQQYVDLMRENQLVFR